MKIRKIETVLAIFEQGNQWMLAQDIDFTQLPKLQCGELHGFFTHYDIRELGYLILNNTDDYKTSMVFLSKIFKFEMSKISHIVIETSTEKSCKDYDLWAESVMLHGLKNKSIVSNVKPTNPTYKYVPQWAISGKESNILKYEYMVKLIANYINFKLDEGEPEQGQLQGLF